MAGASSIEDSLGNAIILFLRSVPSIIAMNLVDIDWMYSLQSAGSYPSNPYTMCPRLMLRCDGESLSPGPPRGGMVQKVVYGYSLFYQERQNVVFGTPRVNHQLSCVSNGKNIISAFTEEAFHPALIESVTGLQSWSVVPVQVEYPDELKHEFDDPNLRISVMSAQLKIEGYISSMLL